MKRIFLVFFLLLSGCDFLPHPSDWKRCRFQIDSVQFEGLRENQTEWKVSLAVHNPNPRRLQLEELRVFALHDGDTLAVMNSVAPVDLAPQDTAYIPLELKLPNAAWSKALNDPNGGKSQVTVVGDAFFHTFLGVKKISGAFRKTYDVDLASALRSMGSRLFQGLFSP